MTIDTILCMVHKVLVTMGGVVSGRQGSDDNRHNSVNGSEGADDNREVL